MAFISLQPMIAFKQFDKSMTNGSLIIAICSALGFAAVISLTKCDVHLVSLLMRPLKKLGVFLLPSCMIVTSVIATAIPSMAGLSAAVGPTMIPIMIRSGFKPAIAAAAVGGCMMPAYLNPGVSHNPVHLQARFHGNHAVHRSSCHDNRHHGPDQHRRDYAYLLCIR